MKEVITVNNEELEVETLRKVTVVISDELSNMLKEYLHVEFDKYGYTDIFSPDIIKEALAETEDKGIKEEYDISEDDIQDLKTIIKLFEKHEISLVALSV